MHRREYVKISRIMELRLISIRTILHFAVCLFFIAFHYAHAVLFLEKGIVYFINIIYFQCLPKKAYSGSV